MIKYLSISQINLHKKNPRRWCLEYIEGIKTPPTKHLGFGSEVHTALETILKGEKYKPWEVSLLEKEREILTNKTIQTLLSWHAINQDWISQHDWNLETPFQVWLSPDLPSIKGIIDMWTFDKTMNKLYVYDHKTTKPGYEEKETTLQNNLQLLLYTYVLSMGKTDISEFEVGHNQFFKTKEMELTRFNTVKTIICPERLKIVIQDIKRECENMVETYKLYKSKGLQAIKETPENRLWFGRECEFWSCITGQETIADCKKRIMNGQ